jgi:hypothetical protein
MRLQGEFLVSKKTAFWVALGGVACVALPAGGLLLFRAVTPHVALPVLGLMVLSLLPIALLLVPGIVKTRRRLRDIAFLKAHGRRIEAIITQLSTKTMKWHTLLFITCQWADTRANLTYTYVSDPIWDTPALGLAGRTQVDVLVDPGDPLKAYVDVSAYGMSPSPVSPDGSATYM